MINKLSKHTILSAEQTNPDNHLFFRTVPNFHGRIIHRHVFGVVNSRISFRYSYSGSTDWNTHLLTFFIAESYSHYFASAVAGARQWRTTYMRISCFSLDFTFSTKAVS